VDNWDAAVIEVTADPAFEQSSCASRVTQGLLRNIVDKPTTLAALDTRYGVTKDDKDVSLLEVKKLLESEGIHTLPMKISLSELSRRFPSCTAILHTVSGAPGKSEGHYVIAVTQSNSMFIVDPPLVSYAHFGSAESIAAFEKGLGYQGTAVVVSKDPIGAPATAGIALAGESAAVVLVVAVVGLCFRRVMRRFGPKRLERVEAKP
jgi:ABC-type bacteriocin/lantibiotic exporter with double-glycine peptidase domain